MLKKLASIKLTFWSLLALMAALGTGVGFTYIKTHSKTIRTISEQLPLDWILKFGSNDGVVLVWFVLSCIVAGFLFLNLLCCTGLRITTILQNTQSTRQWLFVVIHCMFALVMLCHGLGMVLGYKYSNVELWPGDAYAFESDYEIQLSEVVFKDDMDMLKADYQTRRSLMTRVTFHPEKNFARIVLKHKSTDLISEKISMLGPVTSNCVQITMTDFLFNKEDPSRPVGIALVISKNPVTQIFFISYVALIISLIGFVVYTWKP